MCDEFQPDFFTVLQEIINDSKTVSNIKSSPPDFYFRTVLRPLYKEMEKGNPFPTFMWFGWFPSPLEANQRLKWTKLKDPIVFNMYF